tara:strand:- start:1175 stop:1777 length:603 start_codon:yes stop_codon:yes gene_type:complete
MIKHKKHKCKGTGKAQGYGCGTMTMYRVFGLCKMNCYPDWLLNSEQGKILLYKAQLKATQPRIDLEKAQQERKQTTTLSNLIQSTVNVCHKSIRERDKHKPCISCGANWNEHFQAGHFYKAELYSSLRFDEININGQCRICNLHKDGNFQGYREGFIKRYSAEQLEELETKARDYKHQSFKWDREELKDKRLYYNNKLKE